MNPKDQVKEALSILDVVSTYVKLEKSGSQFRARCPFHNERTPSMYVSPERKTFHCFGCGTHGDIFTFVEKIENIPFFDALKLLADRAGIVLGDFKKNEQSNRLIALMADAATFYNSELSRSSEALLYLHNRGLTDETISTFNIGFAQNEWRTLYAHLAKSGYRPEEMVEAGMIIEVEKEKASASGIVRKETTWYDRFRGRVMFPIRNVSGAVVGFSGRIMPNFIKEGEMVGKYVNTPETPLYHKSKILFGYDTAKKTMHETKEVVVVEGQMDLCMSYQAGVRNTIAVSGTAFTDEHVKLIKRFAEKVILAFDSDKAGLSAREKTALMCLYGDVDVYVVSLQAKDPADLIQEDPTLWASALEKKKHIIEAVLEECMEDNISARDRHKKIGSHVLPFVAALRSPLDRDHFLSLIEERVAISKTLLLEEMKKLAATQNSDHKKEENVVTPPTPQLSIRMRREIELIAYAAYQGDESSVTKYDVNPSDYDRTLIEKQIFQYEAMGLAKSPKHEEELVKKLKEAVNEETLKTLTKRLKEEPEKETEILEEIQKLKSLSV